MEEQMFRLCLFLLVFIALCLSTLSSLCQHSDRWFRLFELPLTHFTCQESSTTSCSSVCSPQQSAHKTSENIGGRLKLALLVIFTQSSKTLWTIRLEKCSTAAEIIQQSTGRNHTENISASYMWQFIKISEFWPADKSNHLRTFVWRMESYSLAVEEELRLTAFVSRWFKASLKDQSTLFQPAVVPISVSAVSLWVMLTSAVESQGNKVQAPSSFPPNPSKNWVLH